MAFTARSDENDRGPLSVLIINPDPGGQIITDPDPAWTFLWLLK
jgi:hypothetical protein